jgi:hypothetical protein
MSYTSFTKPIAASTVLAYSEALTVAGELAVSLEISNGSGQAIDNFKVQARDHASGEWYDFITTADIDAVIADAPTGNILFVAGDPGGLANGAKAHLHIRANGVQAIRFGATIASSSGTITIRGGKSSV